MLNVVAAAGAKFVVAGGSILSKNSVLFHPKFKYSHEQIVGGVIFDATVTVLLLGAMFYAAYRYWGPPAKRNQALADNTTLREEGLLLGIQPWVWSLITMAALAIVVVLSRLVYG
jgi:hypothetical protein